MNLPLRTRRQFLQTTVLAGSGLVAGCAGGPGAPARTPAAAAGLKVPDLPVGAAPPALDFAHFPSRLHAFVWRNWPLVPVDRLARVLGTSPRNVRRLGAALGLGPAPSIPDDLQRRSALTVIRRNWHLLPYDQLLLLLNWSPDQLAYSLREDDFLYIKLGSLKPRCEPLVWSAPDAAQRQREAEIAAIVRPETDAAAQVPSEPLFQFVRDLSRPPAANPARTPAAAPRLRFGYSYFALYGDPFLEPAADPYPEGYLARLAAVGATGVWLPGVLYKLARFPWQSGLSAHWEERRAALARLAARCRRQGLSLFLYLNEPRAMPLPFFQDQPHLRGVTEGDHATLCTRVPEVQAYLREAIAGVCRAAPELGGFFTITASENLTHCWSHGGGKGCPRCATRSPAEGVAEANTLLQDGIRAGGGSQRLIAWDWGWGDDWAADAIDRLPAEVSVMSVSEWGLPITRGGVSSEVGEYCLSAVGPGPRARRQWERARARGHRALAKVQVGNTWELSAVPYIPALENVAQHAVHLRAAGIGDVMLGWTLGGYPSPNLEVVAAVMDDETAGGEDRAEAALRRVAERRFGRSLAPAVVNAWRAFSAAFREFPFHVSVVYNAPLQCGPANLLWPQPTGYAGTMVGFGYDHLESWRGPYPPKTFAAQLEAVADGFDRAAAELRAQAGLNAAWDSALPGPARPELRALARELDVAAAAAIHWRSVALQTRFVLAREAGRQAAAQPDRRAATAEMRRLVEQELQLARQLHRLQCRDSRLGFEASNQYFYVPQDLLEKILNCRHLLDHVLPPPAHA